mmetsp:Transcript_1001/g.2201  ORF Transcript_1001/g.2201 Transcript_1001/m.2201 type:complete len:80 (-) Transcript_1001:257-496(-)
MSEREASPIPSADWLTRMLDPSSFASLDPTVRLGVENHGTGQILTCRGTHVRDVELLYILQQPFCKDIVDVVSSCPAFF